MSAEEHVSLFTAADVSEPIENFGILDAVPLADGTVLVSWDPNQTAGGRRP